MHQGQGRQEYIVTSDPEAVSRVRASLLRTLPVAAWAGVAGAAVIVAAVVLLLIALGPSASQLWVLVFAWPAALLLYDARRRFAALRRLKRTWAVKDVSPVAMRLSPEGLRCTIDAAPEPVVLPWSAIDRMRVTGQGLSAVRVDLTPGVSATTPGVSGLDQPETRTRMRRTWKGRTRLRFAIYALREPLSDIDQALGHFSNGRIGIR
ncbi:hypothetical protein [Streptomyces sp. 5-10]|uniref:hypothetical protein n=1 Tax=Streptomyces sp. 5-10 TaxID=878925 RepID=UPI00168B4E56|nr:hypothetical protein [Streptomyces sp. 5-10]MBD3004118.1 hypothetical protein [Streptomyces sp. 5-10]